MELDFNGLKCDCCSYRDDSVRFADYKANINKPCPQCGANLLTQEEYNICFIMVERVKKIKKILSVLRWLNPFHYVRLITGKKNEEVIIEMKYGSTNTDEKDTMTLKKIK